MYGKVEHTQHARPGFELFFKCIVVNKSVLLMRQPKSELSDYMGNVRIKVCFFVWLYSRVMLE